MAAVSDDCTHSQPRGLTRRQGTAISVAFEPILCCRLFLSTHDAVRGVRNGKTDGWTTAAAETVPLQVKARKKSHLDSMGYPSISGAYSLLLWQNSNSKRQGAYHSSSGRRNLEHLTHGHLPDVWLLADSRLCILYYSMYQQIFGRSRGLDESATEAS